MAHYHQIEGIDYWTQALRQNETSLVTLILVWHFAFMNLKVLEESRRIKHAAMNKVAVLIAGLVAIPALLVIITTPILAWLGFKTTLLDTDYWTTRYLLTLLYIIMNSACAIFPHVHNFLFFLSDGVILS